MNLFLRKGGFETPARIGQRGSDIKAAESHREKLGFRPGKVDGVFDPALQKAVERYRRADPQLADGSKRIGTGFWKELRQASKGYEHAPWRRREVGTARGADDRRKLRGRGAAEAVPGELE